MNYKLFLARFFNHFIQPSPSPIAKLKSLHGVLRGWIFWLGPHMITSKSPPNKYPLPSPINMTIMIRRHTKFPPTARSPKQT